jgi:hypothetical protein
MAERDDVVGLGVELNGNTEAGVSARCDVVDASLVSRCALI